MNIQDDKQHTIYEKEINGKKYYRLQIAKKMQDGKYQNGYIDITFVKCNPPKDRERIYLKNAWLSFYLNKDKHTIPYVVCMEYETVEEVIDKEHIDVKKEPETTSFKIEDLDIDPELPF